MNRLLAALNPDECAALALREVDFEAGHVLCDAGQSLDEAFFPLDAIVSHSAGQDDGNAVETGTIGREGLVAVPAMIGDGITYERAVVQVPGRIIVAPAAAVRAKLGCDADFRRLVGAFAQAYAAQVAQSVVCNATHPNEARLSRWLLMCFDRTGRSTLPLGTRFIAEMLGVSRPMVSIVAGTLQTAGLIRLGPGGVTILDCASLEEAACDCYRRIRRTLDRLLPESHD